MNLNDYKTLVFDCDGVILNSNQTKVRAYYEVAKLNGGSDEQAQALADHHVQKGSFPRNGKIEYYLREILHQEVTPERMQLYMDTFQAVLDKSLMQCEVAEGLNTLKLQTPSTKWMVLSGGDQEELRKLFVKRELAHLFELGIFGGPDIKEDVLHREIASGRLQLPALFIGDSKYDYQASTLAGLDFIFLSGWTEVKDWESFVRSENIVTAHNIASLLTV